MISTMFHDLPKTREEADEFFKRYQENFLKRNLLMCLEKAKDVSEIISIGINNLKTEVHSKERMLKESQASVTEARKKRQEITQRIKEDSQKDREEVENKLLEITAICKELENEKNRLILRQQENMLTDNANRSKDLSSLKIAKGLYSNYMKIHLKIVNENKIDVTFLSQKGQKCLTVAFDKTSLAMLQPQRELLDFAKDYEKYGNISLLLLRLRRYALSKAV